MGFYLFKKYLSSPGYSFFFATTCNANSEPLWRTLGGSAVPNSDIESILPLRLDIMIPAFLATKTSSGIASSLARIGGQCATPILRSLTRKASTQLTIEPCQDWEKLAELSLRHRSANAITIDRSAEFLQWRYGPGSPLSPCEIYLLQDKQGNEGWFSLSNLIRKGVPGSFLLDAIWPREKISFKEIFPEIVRVADGGGAAAIFLRRHPGLAYREYSRWVFPHRFDAARAFVINARGAPPIALDSLDYDDNDYVGWMSHWTVTDDV